MLDYCGLQAKLRKVECVCVREGGFLAFVDLTLSTLRFTCGASSAFVGDAAVPSGMSFWVHEGANVAFLGLWTGVLYVVRESSALEELCVDVCVGALREANAPVGALPSPVVAKYGLKEAEVLYLAAFEADHCHDIPERRSKVTITIDEFLDRMKRHVERVEFSPDGTVVLEHGRARAFTRLHSRNHNRPTICFVFFGGLRETEDQVRLLAAIDAASDFSAYDGSWGNRVYMSDPYYSPPRLGARPSRPSNS